MESVAGIVEGLEHEQSDICSSYRILGIVTTIVMYGSMIRDFLVSTRNPSNLMQGPMLTSGESGCSGSQGTGARRLSRHEMNDQRPVAQGHSTISRGWKTRGATENMSRVALPTVAPCKRESIEDDTAKLDRRHGCV